ncbi:MAG: hypothetical protein ACK41D_04430 [Rubricoccaceae bacterium]
MSAFSVRALLTLVLVPLVLAGCARPPAAGEPLRLARADALGAAEQPAWARRAGTLRLPEARLDTLPPGTPLEIDVFDEARLAARVRRTDRAGGVGAVTAVLERPHAGVLLLTFAPGAGAQGSALVSGTLRWESAGRRFALYAHRTPGHVVLAEVRPGDDDELPGAPPLVPEP